MQSLEELFLPSDITLSISPRWMLVFGVCIMERHYSESIQEEIFQLNYSDDSGETGMSQSLYSFGFLSKNVLFGNQ